MPYAEGRTFHDADSHVMETPDWLFPFADPDVRPRLRPLRLQGVPEAKTERFVDKLREQHRDAQYRKDDASQLMLRKNWNAWRSCSNRAGFWLSTHPIPAAFWQKRWG